MILLRSGKQQIVPLAVDTLSGPAVILDATDYAEEEGSLMAASRICKVPPVKSSSRCTFAC
jgi:hypothetical protein